MTLIGCGLEGRGHSTGRMAAEIDGDRQPRDVRWVDFDVHTKRRDASTETLGTDTEFIDPFEQLAFELPDISARTSNVERSQHGLFPQHCGALDRSADAQTDNDSRQPIRP